MVEACRFHQTTAINGTHALSQAVLSEDAALEFVPAETGDADNWDAFVDAHPEGRFSQLWGFRRALQDCYGFRCVYLNILAEGKRIGVFPSVVLGRHPRRLLSLPFIEYGGPLFLNLSAVLYPKLCASLLQLAHGEACELVEIRGGVGLEPPAELLNWAKRPKHYYATLPLREPTQLWRDSLTNEARKGVNRALKEGLQVEIKRGAAAVENEFFCLYFSSMKRLGVPPHARQFFLSLADGLKERLVASWVRRGKETVAVLLGGISGCRVHIFTIVSEPRAWSYRPNDLAHWELIRWAHGAGLQIFDFGSARYTGQIQFKKKWGASLNEYCQHWIGATKYADSLRVEAMQSSSRLMQVASYVWRRAVPLALTRKLGPAVRKYMTR
jgi:hypothetical protein